MNQLLVKVQFEKVSEENEQKVLPFIGKYNYVLIASLIERVDERKTNPKLILKFGDDIGENLVHCITQNKRWDLHAPFSSSNSEPSLLAPT